MGAGAPEEFTNGRTWMQSRTSILAGAAVLALTATPTLAMTHHHHRMHHSQLHESTPAERQQTADLNRQQLAKAENAGSTVSTATATSGTTEQNNLQTQPTSYQRATGSNGSMSSSSGAAATDATAETPPPSNGAPDAAMPEGNPSGTATPATTEPSGTPQ
jgi:hypothetical protein